MKLSTILNEIDIPRSEDVYYPEEDSFLFIDYLDTDEFNRYYLMPNLTGRVFGSYSVQSNQNAYLDQDTKKEIVIKILDMGCGSGILGFFTSLKYLIELRSHQIGDVKRNFIIETDFVDLNEKALDITKELIEINRDFLNYYSDTAKNEVSVNFNYIKSNLFNSFSIDSTKSDNNPYDFVVFNPPYLPFEPDLIDATNKKIIDESWDGGDETGNSTLLKFFNKLAEFSNNRTNIFYITSSHANITHLIENLDTMGFNTYLIESIHIFFEDIMLFHANLR